MNTISVGLPQKCTMAKGLDVPDAYWRTTDGDSITSQASTKATDHGRSQRRAPPAGPAGDTEQHDCGESRGEAAHDDRAPVAPEQGTYRGHGDVEERMGGRDGGREPRHLVDGQSDVEGEVVGVEGHGRRVHDQFVDQGQRDERPERAHREHEGGADPVAARRVHGQELVGAGGGAPPQRRPTTPQPGRGPCPGVAHLPAHEPEGSVERLQEVRRHLVPGRHRDRRDQQQGDRGKGVLSAQVTWATDEGDDRDERRLVEPRGPEREGSAVHQCGVSGQDPERCHQPGEPVRGTGIPRRHRRTRRGPQPAGPRHGRPVAP